MGENVVCLVTSDYAAVLSMHWNYTWHKLMSLFHHFANVYDLSFSS